MPPCGNCHECCLTRLPQKTSLRLLSRMMPTFGRYPSLSSMPTPEPLESATHYRGRNLAITTTNKSAIHARQRLSDLDSERSTGGRRGHQPFVDAARRDDQKAGGRHLHLH